MKGALATSRASDRAGPARQSRRPIRLMIVDDSMVARAVLSRMIDADGNFEIAGIAGTAEDAIEALGQVMVDIVLLDLEMPGVGGLKSIPRILEAAKGAKVLIVSSLAEDGAEETVAALALGAADTCPSRVLGGSTAASRKCCSASCASWATPIAPLKRRSLRSSPAMLRPQSDQPLQLLAIGASTGGIHALGAFFAALPKRIGVPILVTQHLAGRLHDRLRPPAVGGRGARGGGGRGRHRLLPDRIVIAPGEAHLLVDEVNGKLVARLLKTKVASGCMPSVDPMLASAGNDIRRRRAGRGADRHGPRRRRRSQAAGRSRAAR